MYTFDFTTHNTLKDIKKYINLESDDSSYGLSTEETIHNYLYGNGKVNKNGLSFYFYGTSLSIAYLTHPYIRSRDYIFYVDKDTDDEKKININFSLSISERVYTFNNLKQGKHKFEMVNNDSSYSYWDIASFTIDDGEEIFNHNYLINSNQKIYSLNSYDSENKQYKELETYDLNKDGFGFYKLNQEVTINDETFKPFSKFNSFKLLTDRTGINIKVNGIKSTNELIVSKQSLSSIMATNIHKFLLDSSILGNANILTVVSDDNGSTWKYYKNNQWNTMTNHIDCNVNYNNMSDEQKQAWDNFKTEIITNNSMTPEELESADFELLRNGNKNTKFRFGFVIIQQDTDSNSQLKAIKINEDKDGGYNELTAEQINVNINYGYITLTPKENFNDKVLVNLQAIKQDNTPPSKDESDK